MSRVLQDEVTRRRRLNEGRCPTHGIALAQVGVAVDDDTLEPVGDMLGCPRRDCDVQVVARPGSKVWKALHP